MSEDPPSITPHRTWFARLTQALSGEPQSREELIEELRHAQANGLLSNDTLSMIEGAIKVAELTVADVMVPRAQTVFIPIDAPQRDILNIVIESGHSRFPRPRWRQGRDPRHPARQGPAALPRSRTACDIRALLRPVAMIPESKRLNILLNEFRLSRSHMAIVVDEYGGVAGLVTIEDVLEQIVGDIDDEHDIEEADPKLILAQPDGRFLVSALTPIADFNERFGSEFSDDEFDTVGAWSRARWATCRKPARKPSSGRSIFRSRRPMRAECISSRCGWGIESRDSGFGIRDSALRRADRARRTAFVFDGRRAGDYASRISPIPNPESRIPALDISSSPIGPGPIFWERFGHNAIVVRDRDAGTAIAYNYGIFDFEQDNFLENFARGNMRYRIAADRLDDDIEMYREESRSIVEQRLDFTPEQAVALRDFCAGTSGPRTRSIATTITSRIARRACATRSTMRSAARSARHRGPLARLHVSHGFAAPDGGRTVAHARDRSRARAVICRPAHRLPGRELRTGRAVAFARRRAGRRP